MLHMLYHTCMHEYLSTITRSACKIANMDKVLSRTPHSFTKSHFFSFTTFIYTSPTQPPTPDKKHHCSVSCPETFPTSPFHPGCLPSPAPYAYTSCPPSHSSDPLQTRCKTYPYCRPANLNIHNIQRRSRRLDGQMSLGHWPRYHHLQGPRAHRGW